VDEALRDADAVMALRIQKERMASGLLPSLREYAARYGLTRERLAFARPGALVMHPGPMNEGVEIAPDVAAGVQSLIEEQVRNGVAVRMALLYLLAGTHPGGTGAAKFVSRLLCSKRRLIGITRSRRWEATSRSTQLLSHSTPAK
jgi:hypothetical protein